MTATRIQNGLDLPLPGATPSGDVVERLGAAVVALIPDDSLGIKTRALVAEGDAVKVGTPLYCDRRDPEVLYTSPAAGTVRSISRGARRKVLSVQIEVAGFDEHHELAVPELEGADDKSVRAVLMQSGLWATLRRRPFDRVARSDETPAAIFVSGASTHPHAPAPLDLLDGRQEDFGVGLRALKLLTTGEVFVCTKPGEDWTGHLVEGAQHHTFSGKHPAGNVGVHIHSLSPVGPTRFVWHVGPQDVADIGALFRTKQLNTTRVVGVSGPGALEALLVRTRRGAHVEDVTSSFSVTKPRVIVGSVLGGREASGEQAFLGRYADQLSVLEDAVERKLLAWVLPFAGKHSVSNVILDKFFRKELGFDTDLNGSERAIVPTGSYERVMPMDIMATQLIKALASGDLEMAEKLGVLELAEEDIALCEYVCPSKMNITGLLREMLTRIEVEG